MIGDPPASDAVPSGAGGPPAVPEGRARALACGIAALTGFGLALVAFYPGVVTVDSAIQLGEARAAAYHDWHPPLMAYIWSMLDRVIPGPPGMLLFNNVLFWSGLALVAYVARLSPLLSAAAILSIGLWPPIFSALAVIWKDVTLAALLLLGFALLWYAHARASRRVLLLAVPLLICAAAWRHNAAAAILPMALWIPFIWTSIGAPRQRASYGRLAAAGLALFVVFSGVTLVMNRSLTNAGRQYPAQQLLLYDLVAISARTGHVYLPASLRSDGEPTIDALRCVYSPQSVGPLFDANAGACPLRIVKITDSQRMADLSSTWLRAIIAEPRAYLAHRWDVFREQFAIGVDRVCYPLHVGQDPDELGNPFQPSRLYRPLLKLHTKVAYGTPLFRGWIYLVVLGAALLLAALRRGPIPVIVLAASGLLYGLTYLAVGSACPFRLHWWSVVAALTVLLVAVRRQETRKLHGS
jgi:hypothetical protein